MDTFNISGTEWPVFSSVFYLWSTEALQKAWEEDPSLSEVMPAKYARGTIEAATALIADPGHAKWVKDHWGEDYLKRENLFYRMLLISGLTSYEKLLCNSSYRASLAEQVDTLAKEIDASPYGLLDDYPSECYPVDILPAIAAIRRADKVLETDHGEFAARALRGFQGAILDPETELPAYIADSKTGLGYGSARGVGLSFMLIWAPELWPETAREWYETYEKHFWQKGRLVAGFREFPQNYSHARILYDVDAGPVLAGYGVAASAFGIGAARANGHFEHSYPLSTEALVASWPLPNGTLLIPMLMSNLSDAPYVGESALLFSLTRQPIISNGRDAGSWPLSVSLALCFYAGLAIALTVAAIARIVMLEKRFRKEPRYTSTRKFTVWVVLIMVGTMAFLMSWPIIGSLLILLALLVPWKSRYSCP